MTLILNLSGRGFSKQNTENTRRKLEILKMFIEEARVRRESGRVGYRWWVNFNYRLSVLISVEKSGTNPGLLHEKDWISDSGLEAHYAGSDTWPLYFNPSGLNCFPEVTLCPIKNGKFGYFTFNRIATTRVYPLGLVNKNTIVDGRRTNPQHFFEHDELHIRLSDQTMRRLERNGLLEEKVIPFHRAFLQKMDTLSLSERRYAEWVYFVLLHEHSYMFWRNERQVSTQEELVKAELHDVKKKHIPVFMDVVHEIERDLGW